MPDGDGSARVSTEASERPAAATAMASFCAATVVFLVVRDLLLPEVRDVEVWLGLELRGAWARWTAPLHWALYALASLAFWRGARLIWPLAIGYAAAIALGHLIWNLTSPRGAGLGAGLFQLALFSVAPLVLWRIAPRSHAATSRETTDPG